MFEKNYLDSCEVLINNTSCTGMVTAKVCMRYGVWKGLVGSGVALCALVIYCKS